MNLFRPLFSLLLLILFPFLMQAQGIFGIPVSGQAMVSGSFGELRSNHFHSGTDFRTGGKEGMPVLATGDGCVSRIKNSTVGYGLALYIDHDSTFTSVYAHLHHLTGPAADYMDSAQCASKQFEIELFPDPGRFCFLKGDTIAVSGNSGSSEGPHLHFEIRERSSQNPLNPIDFLPEVPDSALPEIVGLALYKMSGNLFKPVLFQNTDSINQERIVLETDTGRFFLGVLTHDVREGGTSGIRSIALTDSDLVLFSFRMDRFDFNETRYANAHADQLSGQRYHRLFRLPGDGCSVFRNSGEGMILVGADRETKLNLTVSNHHANTRSLEIILKGRTNSSNDPENQEGKLIHFGLDEDYTTHNGAILKIRNNALYQDCILSKRKKIKSEKLMTDIYPVAPEISTPMHVPCEISIPSGKISDRIDEKKLLLLRFNDSIPTNPEVIFPVKASEGRITGMTRRGGWFALDADTIAPELMRTDSLIDEVDSTLFTACYVKDNLSGIDSWKIELNGQWILSIYDPKKQRIYWPVSRYNSGINHILLSMTDRCGNRSEHAIEFRVD